IDLVDEVGHLGAHFLDVRWNEMDHALEPHGQFAEGRGRTDRERLEEITRQLHRLAILRIILAKLHGIGIGPVGNSRRDCRLSPLSRSYPMKRQLIACSFIAALWAAAPAQAQTTTIPQPPATGKPTVNLTEEQRHVIKEIVL